MLGWMIGRLTVLSHPDFAVRRDDDVSAEAGNKEVSGGQHIGFGDEMRLQCLRTDMDMMGVKACCGTLPV